jgi:hypothetical protein
VNAVQSFKMSRSTHPATLACPKSFKTLASLVLEHKTCVTRIESRKMTVACQGKLMSLKSILSLVINHQSADIVYVILFSIVFMKLYMVLILGVLC